MVVFPQITYSNSSTKYKCTLVHGPLNIWTRNRHSMKVPRYLCTGLCQIYERTIIKIEFQLLTIRVKQVTLSVLNVVLVPWSHIILVLVVDVYCLGPN